MQELIDAAVAELVPLYVRWATERPTSEPLYGLATYAYFDGDHISQLTPDFMGQLVVDRERLLAEGRLGELFDETSRGNSAPR